MALKVLFAASECAPLVEVGGLAHAVGSLSKALQGLGVEVGIVLPAYKGLSGIKTIPGSDIPVFLVENEDYFGSSEKPYWGTDIDPQRFGYFSRQVVHNLPHWGFKPDVIHLHDWHTALVSSIVRKLNLPYATVLTIHNLTMQGVTASEVLFPLGLSETDLRTLEWDSQERSVDQLLQGIIDADLISAVSPTYAKEVLSPEFGEGFHEILRIRKAYLFGVLNGINCEVYDPSQDKEIYQNFDLNNFGEGKAANKKKLQEELGLAVDQKIMLIGFVGCLTDQKGLSLIIEGFRRMMDLPIQFVLLGVGDSRYERQVRDLARSHSGKFSVQIADDPSLTKRICSASDLFLIPSRFEPSGLTPMIVMRYGVLPLVHATGGLNDAVVDGENGFVFGKYEASQMLACLRRALKAFSTPKWRQMVTVAMQKDFSWERSAEEYTSLYRQALEFAKCNNSVRWRTYAKR